MQIYKKSTAAEAGENWGLSAFFFGYYVAEKFFTRFLTAIKSNIESMFPIWKDLSPIEGFYIPYIHLIKCFPLKSYIWPHIGPGRSWRRFLFLSKLVMSPDNSGGEGLFSSTFFQLRHVRRRRNCEAAPPHCPAEMRLEILIINNSWWIYWGICWCPEGTAAFLGSTSLALCPKCDFLEGSLCPGALWALLSPGCPQSQVRAALQSSSSSLSGVFNFTSHLL